MSDITMGEFIRELNSILAQDIMNGIQWCDLEEQEQGWFLEMWDRGLIPSEALDLLAEGM